MPIGHTGFDLFRLHDSYFWRKVARFLETHLTAG